jgi:hypothetical protein
VYHRKSRIEHKILKSSITNIHRNDMSMTSSSENQFAERYIIVDLCFICTPLAVVAIPLKISI